jgi:RNAse (barnase) inhibitor barstar
MKQFALKGIVAFSMVLALSGCRLTNPTEMRISVIEERQYFAFQSDRATIESNLLSLSKLPLADQYRLYMYDINSSTYGDKLITQRGSAAVPFLLERLKASKNDYEIHEIYRLFSLMARAKIYHADDDDAVWQTLMERTTRPFTESEYRASKLLTELVEIQELNPAHATNAANAGKAQLRSQVCSLELWGSTPEVCNSKSISASEPIAAIIAASTGPSSKPVACSACRVKNPAGMHITKHEERHYFASQQDDAAAELNLSKRPLADQYRLYLYGIHNLHPYRSYGAHLITKHGSAVVPILLERLKVSKNNFEILNIYHLFSSMASSAIYYADDDDAVWQTLIERTTLPFTKDENLASMLLTQLIQIQKINPANATNAANAGKAGLYGQMCSSKLLGSKHIACPTIKPLR